MGVQMQQVSGMGQNTNLRMATGRALTTDTDRECLAGEKGDQRMYEARSRIRARINGPLADDIELFAEHFPEAVDALRAVVCEEDGDGS